MGDYFKDRNRRMMENRLRLSTDEIYKYKKLLHDDKIVCPICKGEGYFERVEDDDTGYTDLVPCSKCEGEGRISKEVIN